MSYEGWGDQQYQQSTGQGSEGWNNQNNYVYDSGLNEFGQEQSFQSFDYTTASSSIPNQGENYAPPPSYTSNSAPAQQSYFVPGPTIMTPGVQNGFDASGVVAEEDEPPLIEELGIDPDAIIQKTLNVLNPLRHTDPSMLQDTDLAGPLVFCLAFGSFLLLSGKVHFGYIYGIGLFGCFGLYALLNLMSIEGVRLGVVVSVLGYCLLPMVGLAGVNVLLSLQGAVGTILTTIAILWCSWSASKLFVTALSMHHQQPLVAYPCGLFYAIFALITIF